jgi:antitoxin MazE
MKTSVQKWGNSLAVRIPKSFAEEMGVGNNAPVEMSLEAGVLLIKPDRDRSWHLDALLSKTTDENVHPEWEAEAAADGRYGEGMEGDGN